MNYYLAPMEGLTTYIFRNTFAKYYGGFDRYFTPFIVSRHLNHREKEDVLPEHNKGLTVIPQILTNRPDEFMEIAQTLKDYGYSQVNLNLGCPSGTVVSKHRGSGFLAVPDELDRFLYELFDKSPLPISIKTRLGVADESEWDRILEIYAKYPLTELIIHTRIQKDFYKEPTRPAAFQKAIERLSVPLCYNGDIFSKADLSILCTKIPDIQTVMIGRGILANPNLLHSLKGEPSSGKDTLQSFHDELLMLYQERIEGGDRNVLFKMKELWVHLGNNFTEPEKYLKKIKKATTLSDYQEAVRFLFRDQQLRG